MYNQHGLGILNHLRLQNISKKQRWILGFIFIVVIILSTSVTDPLTSLLKASLLKFDAGNLTYFPNGQQIIDNQGEFAFGEITFLLDGVFFLFFLAPLVLIFFRNKLGLIILLSVAPFGCVAFFIGGLQTILTYQEITTELKYRIPINQIAQIEISRLDDETGVCSSLILTDQKIIADGFEELTQAQSKRLSHEGFSAKNGYSIALSFIDADEHYPYLIVHRESTQRRIAEAVVPQFSSRGKTPTEGYSSPEFYRWLAEYVDPYFQNCDL